MGFTEIRRKNPLERNSDSEQRGFRAAALSTSGCRCCCGPCVSLQLIVCNGGEGTEQELRHVGASHSQTAGGNECDRSPQGLGSFTQLGIPTH